MGNLFPNNEKICGILKKENNEVVYYAWLFYSENAFRENNNVIIPVPDLYTKDILEERYLSYIETVYRNEVKIDNVFVRCSENNPEPVPVSKAYKTELQDSPNKIEQIIEKVNCLIEKLLGYIEAASGNGNNSCTIELDKEYISTEDLYFRVKALLIRKGLKAEFNKTDNRYTLYLSW